MDRQFIKTMVDSYFNDKNLNSLNLWANRDTCITELNNEIITLIENIKLEDESFYFEIFNLGRGNQQELIYKILDNFILEFYFPNDNDTFPKQYDNEEHFLIDLQMNESVGSAISTAASAVSGVAQAHPFITAGMIGAGIIGFILLFSPGPYRAMSRLGWRIMDKMNEISFKIYKTLKKLSASSRVKIILYVNTLELCMKKCNIKSPHDIDAYIGVATSGNITTAKIEAQRTCLTMCYFNWMIDQIGVLSSAYRQCLNANGSFDNIDSKMIFIQQNMKSECQQLYDLLEEYHKQFMEVTNYLTRDHPEIRADILDKYNAAINTGLSKPVNKIQNMNNAPSISGKDIHSGQGGHRPFPPRDGKGPRPFGNDGRRPFQRQDNNYQVRKFGKDSI